MFLENSNLIVNGSELKGNTATSTTGGIHIISSAEIMMHTRIKGSSFINNSPPCNNNIKKCFFAATYTPNNHVNLFGSILSLQSITVSLFYPSTPHSNLKLAFMSATSQSGEINTTGLNITCSQYFFVETNQITKPNRKLELSCVTCSPNDFTLENNLLVHHYN